MSEPKFIITRFTHGAAGKFLSTILQTSNKIDHWSTIIQSQKHNKELFNLLVLEYTCRSFPSDHSQYLQAEPMVPYNVDLYSVGYDRGNNVSLDQYLTNAHVKQDFRLIDCLQSNRYANLIFNKPQTPIFCNDSPVVTILVESQKEKNWLFKTLWSKHFLEKDGEIRYLPSDPSYCNFHSLISVLNFKNLYRFPISEKEQVFNRYVVNNHTNAWYSDFNNFTEHDKKKRLNNLFITLDEILISDKFLRAIEKIFDYFNIGIPDLNLIEQMHQIWLSRQLSYDQ